MFKIGEFSKLSNTTVRTLRHYEKLGLLLPASVDEFSGYRYYKAEQLENINEIKFLQQVGLSLESIKEIIKKNQSDILKYYYEIKENELTEEIAILNKKKEMLNKLQIQLEEGNNLKKYNVVLKSLPARKVASVRRRLLAYQEEGQLWALLEAELPQKVKIAPTSFPVSIYHDEEYKETDVDVEVQLEVMGDYNDTDVIKFFTDAERLLASVTFNGGFEQMPKVTQAIGAWIESNHYQVTGPMINISHVSPGQDPNPSNWITEASFVVAPK